MVKNKHLGVFVILTVVQLVLVFLIHGVVVGYDLSKNEEIEEAGSSPEAVGGLSNCRFGASVSNLADLDWIDDLGAGWYLNFSYEMAPAPNSAEYVALVTISQHKTTDGVYLPTYATNPPLNDNGLGQLIDARPGSLWIVGNEVDRGPNPGQVTGGQGDTFPDIYAEGYHEVYNFIKQRDPTAQVGNSALVQVTPGRLQYLDLMWEAYKTKYGAIMPVDVWNMHLYILPEVKPNGQPNGVANVALGTDPAFGRKESGGSAALCPLINVYCVAEHDDMDAFNEQIVAMRVWMKEHDQQEKPLILSEFSILYPYTGSGNNCSIKDEFGNCFTPQRVTDFLNSSFDYLYNTADPTLGYSKDGNRLIQQSLWFSINNQGDVGASSDLVRNNTLTQAGSAFQSYVQGMSTNVNLFVDMVFGDAVETGGGNTASATISVVIRNDENVAPDNNFFVTFYKDAGLTMPFGTATVSAPNGNNPGMTGCSRMARTVSIVWSNLSPGIYPFWVKVDSTNNVIETSESDNIGSGLVIVNGKQVFLPMTVR